MLPRTEDRCSCTPEHVVAGRQAGRQTARNVTDVFHFKPCCCITQQSHSHNSHTHTTRATHVTTRAIHMPRCCVGLLSFTHYALALTTSSALA